MLATVRAGTDLERRKEAFCDDDLAVVVAVGAVPFVLELLSSIVRPSVFCRTADAAEAAAVATKVAELAEEPGCLRLLGSFAAHSSSWAD